MRYLLLLLTFLAGTARAAEFNSVINCRALLDGSSCRMYREGSQFMRVNGRPITYYTAPNCKDNDCDWQGKTSSHDLVVGTNSFNFSVHTVTQDDDLQTKHLYRFLFNGIKRFEYVSRREGWETDSVSFNFDMDLEDIDKALYRRYQDYLRRLQERGELARKYDREMNDLEKKLNEAYDKLKYLDDLYANFEQKIKNFDDLTPEMLEELGLSPEYVDSVKKTGAGFEELYGKADESIRNFEETQRVTQAKLKQELKTYNVELDDPIVENVEAPKETAPSTELPKLVADIENDQIAIESALRRKNGADLVIAIDSFRMRFDLLREIYATSTDLSASDKVFIFEKQSETYAFLIKNKISNEGWVNGRDLSKENRTYIDSQIKLGNKELAEVKESILLSKVAPAHIPLVNRILDGSRILHDRIAKSDTKIEHEKIAGELAKSALESAHEKLNSGIKRSDGNELASAEDSISLGLKLLDFGTDILPGISTAKSAYAIATGKNFVTGAPLTDQERSLELVGLFVGFYGGKILTSNVSLKILDTVKDVFQRTKRTISSTVNEATLRILNSSLKSKSILTPFGPAVQKISKAALGARVKVEEGAYLYRIGTKGKSETGMKAQFWSLEHPHTPGYAQRYGIPEENIAKADFIERGKLKPGTEFVTREAPAVGSNPGMGIEVVVKENGVDLDVHVTLDN